MTKKPKWRRSTPEEEAKIDRAVRAGKIKMASQDQVEGDPGVDELLRLLGHPEAFVTDESRIGDMLCSVEGPDTLEVQVRAGAKITLPARMTFVEALKTIREFEPGWPNRSTTQ